MRQGTGDMNMSSKKKVVAIAITTVALTAGSFGVATAASKTTKVTRTSISTIAGQAASGKFGRGQELATILSGLVTKGTITQAQADAIIAALTAAQNAEDALRPEMGPRGGKGGPLNEHLTVIASTLGIDTTTVITRLKAGDSLATIAGGKKDALIAALVADETKEIDAAVTAGELTAAQATSMKANLTARITDVVNATPPVGAPKGGPMGGDDRGGRGDKGGRGHGGPMGGGAPTIPAPTTTSSSKA
jgi:polyhydroxyalkanoate synthesis regulator phasin